jgi:3-isopropylmalate/(R)-2-methylmalate dehydratase large subunit
MSQPRTLLDKIWQNHIVAAEPGCPSVLYIDLHLVHEVTSPQAFDGLRARGLMVRRPDRTFATIDHSIPTHDPSLPIADNMCAKQIAQLETNCREFGITLFGRGDPRRGVVHTIGPELGLTQPGQTVVCGDSHTATHGAFGALAFGIGTSEVEHVLATQCLLQSKPQSMRVEITGQAGPSPLPPGVTAKDVILALIGRIGIGGGTGHVIEYTGSAIRALSMEERMTICNMTIEAGARAGMVAPDDNTFQYLAGRPYAPQGESWDRAVAAWRSLPSDEGAAYDRTVSLNVGALPPMITFGTNPAMVMTVVGRIPDPSLISTALPRQALEKALAYMGLQPGEMLLGHPIDVVFLGSCTNGRISDLRMAAALLKGRKVARGVRMLVVPGSEEIKRQAESEGLDHIFKQAGAQWREPGCSMCIGMNGDTIQPGQFAVSTSNRNFEGRQGKGGRTLLASPLTAVASAVAGSVADPRLLVQ